MEKLLIYLLVTQILLSEEWENHSKIRKCVAITNLCDCYIHNSSNLRNSIKRIIECVEPSG